MQSENLLRADYPLEHNNNLSNSSSPVNSPEQQDQLANPPQFFGNTDFLPGTDSSDFHNIPGFNPSLPTTNNNSSGHNHLVENNANDVSPTVAGLLIPGLPIQPQIPSTQQLPIVPVSQILGSTPLSQIGCPPLTIDQYSGQLSPCASSDEIDSELDSNTDELGSNFSNNSGSKRQKRGILPKHATSVMRAWLFQHLVVGFFFLFYLIFSFDLNFNFFSASISDGR